MRQFGGMGSWLCGAIAGIGLIVSAGTALAGAYEFAPAPEIDLNRMYRIDKVTGEVSACQYGVNESAGGTVGVTLCYATGEGAGPQAPGEYGLVATRHVKDGGIFRVNYRSGQMSVCYVLEGPDGQKVVCTPPGLTPGETTPAAAAVGKSSTPTSAPR